MSYIRVIPRDLFNEANLLKCYGRIWINLETANLSGVELVHDGDAFDIQQDESTGATYVSNVQLIVRDKVIALRRGLNSRECWPLLAVLEDEEEIPVFLDDGSFSPEILAFLKGK